MPPAPQRATQMLRMARVLHPHGLRLQAPRNEVGQLLTVAWTWRRMASRTLPVGLKQLSSQAPLLSSHSSTKGAMLPAPQLATQMLRIARVPHPHGLRLQAPRNEMGQLLTAAWRLRMASRALPVSLKQVSSQAPVLSSHSATQAVMSMVLQRPAQVLWMARVLQGLRLQYPRREVERPS